MTKDVEHLLSQPLNPKHVRKPTGAFGPKGDYIEGWHAIAEANRIFGHDGWSYAPVSLEQVSLVEGVDGKGKPQWQAAYTCLVRVSAIGVERTDVGFGSGFAKQVGDAVEGATKEAVTDALKRCLRTFGHPFGLALYDKARTHVGVPDPEPADLRDRIKAAIGKTKIRSALKLLWENPKTEAAMDGLPEPMQLELQRAYSDHWDALPEDPTLEKDAA